MQPYSKNVEENIRLHALRDLEPSWLLSHTKVAVATVVGGLLSLAICGQFGVALTATAGNFNHAIHSNMGALPCAIICGTLYAIFPVIVMRIFLCRPIQFRAIIKKRVEAVALWFIGFGGAMASMGHHGTDIWSLAAWIAGAMATTHLLTLALNSLMPAFDWRFPTGNQSAM